MRWHRHPRRVILLQELGEQRHREVDLPPARAPDETLLDERLPVHGGPPLIADPEGVRHLAHRVGPFTE